jgi:hypothetical protein
VHSNPRFPAARTPAAISVFQEARAADTLVALLSGHTGTVRSATYSRDGAHIVTASNDKTARSWDAAAGTALVVLAGHGDTVRSAVYSPDGTHILTASEDKTVRIWDSALPAPLAAQIAWYAAAQIDVMSEVDRLRLGLAQFYETVGGEATRARDSYRRGADGGEPHAFARLARQAEHAALGAHDPARRNPLLLDAFASYTAAAEAARAAVWPDAAWLEWRYRRATFARLLGRAGLMREVATEYLRQRSGRLEASLVELTRLDPPRAATRSRSRCCRGARESAIRASGVAAGNS